MLPNYYIMKKISKIATLISMSLLLTNYSFSQIEIALRKSFIDSLKHKVCIETEYNVVHAHERANPPAKDGDIHIAGLTTNVGLATVAEIMNAKPEVAAIKVIHDNEGTEDYFKMIGVWRICCEHSGESKQIQGQKIPKIKNTNPDHVFEIHPVTKVKNIDLTKTLKPIVGYRYKEANDAFSRYANVRCKLKDKGDMVSIQTNGVGYNYVDFWIEIIDAEQKEVEDGRFVFCAVLDKDKEVVCSKMRMVFPKDSPAEKKIKTMGEGERLHVIGVPRMSLALISYRIENASENPEMLEWNLPMEMIIVAKL